MDTVQQIDVAHCTPIIPSFRVQQVAGLFDLPAAKNSVEHFHAELPALNSDWQIGLIVGPSGSGKSSIAKKAYHAELYDPDNIDWHPDAAVIDNYPADLSIKQITATLTAVGFSSPPGWLKPFRVLSGGEQFRANLARALLTTSQLVVFDEFTSVVDRTVAMIASAALAKGLRKQRFPTHKFIAVGCHYDVIPWLTPDWVFDTATYKLARGSLQHRPPIDLTLHPSSYATWHRFKRHHYLSAGLNKSARCYLARWHHEPVCFVATLPNMGQVGCRRITRIVTLPDFQGIGIGTAVLEAVAAEELTHCQRVTITTSHPALFSYFQRSPRWRTNSYASLGYGNKRRNPTASAGRPVATFQYIPITARTSPCTSATELKSSAT